MPQESYEELWRAFSHKLNLNSDWVILRQICQLTGVKPVLFDCCSKLCICYSRKYKHLQECPFCGTGRYLPSGKPRAQFVYFPLSPHLQVLFKSVPTIEKMFYQVSFAPSAEVIRDVFDGTSIMSHATLASRLMVLNYPTNTFLMLRISLS